MRRLFVFISAILGFIGFSFAANTTLNHSYTVENNKVTIYWTDNSNGGNVGIDLWDPETNDWLFLGTAKISDQSFTYTKQQDGEQKIRLIPDNGGEDIQFTIPANGATKSTVNRTVISAVPKTGPSFSLVGIILATLAIFGGYIYIKKRADI